MLDWNKIKIKNKILLKIKKIGLKNDFEIPSNICWNAIKYLMKFDKKNHLKCY